MENFLTITNTKNISNDIDITKDKNILEVQNINVFSNILSNLIDKGTNYIIDNVNNL